MTAVPRTYYQSLMLFEWALQLIVEGLGGDRAQALPRDCVPEKGVLLLELTELKCRDTRAPKPGAAIHPLTRSPEAGTDVPGVCHSRRGIFL